jgi:hypothetical protein
MTAADSLSEAQARAIWHAVAEARAALALWGEHVRALVEGGATGKVVPLHRPAALILYSRRQVPGGRVR